MMMHTAMKIRRDARPAVSKDSTPRNIEYRRLALQVDRRRTRYRPGSLGAPVGALLLDARLGFSRRRRPSVVFWLRLRQRRWPRLVIHRFLKAADRLAQSFPQLREFFRAED